MKTHTYSFRAKNFTTKEVIHATIDAKGKEQAQNAALMDTQFKGCEILMSSFKRTKYASSKDIVKDIEKKEYKRFLKHLDNAINSLHMCRMENNGAVLSMPIKQLYSELVDFDPWA